MTDSKGILREVSWPDVCPWLLIMRTLALAVRPGVLFLASLGVLLTPLGWRCAEFVFISAEVKQQDPGFGLLAERQRQWPSRLPGARPGSPGIVLPDDSGWRAAWRGTLPAVFNQMSAPYRRLFSSGPLRVTQLAYLVAGALWTLLVWALAGGAITRIAVVRLGRDEGTSVAAAFTFALRRLRSYCLAPLFPLGAIVAITCCALLLGLLMKADVGVLVAGLLWWLVLLAAVAMTTLLLGLAFGWPLMWPAISAEVGGDEFEALHRSFYYTYGKPLRYAFYAVVAALLGGGGSLLVDLFSGSVTYLADWSVSWGMGFERWSEVTRHGDDGTAGGTLGIGLALINFFERGISVIAVGFRYSFFWCAASAIYLVLRLDADQAEFDEVYTEEEKLPQGLPPLKKDEAGVAGLAEDSP